MTRFINKRFTCVLLLIYAFLISGYTQNTDKPVPERYVEIRARAELELQPLKGATIRLYEDNNEKNSIVTGHDGVFSFKLDMNKYYIIEISKQSFISKRLAFDTHVSDDVTGIWIREFSISVLSSCESVDYSALKDPVDVIKFNERKQEFESDKDYAYKMESKIDNIFMQLEKCKTDKYQKNIDLADQKFNGKSLEEATKYYETALEVFPDDEYAKQKLEQINQQTGKQENIDKLYTKTIGEADALYAQKNYEEAMLKYKGAQTLKPQETYPRQKITEIDTVLAKSQANQQLANANESQYNNLVARGNMEMNNKNYAAAKQAFQQAFELKPGDQSLQTKITQLDNFIAEQAKTQQKQKLIDETYTNNIAQADNQFNAGNYEAAKELYIKASGLKSVEKYPAAKIAEIDKLVQANKATADRAKTAELEKQYQSLLEQGDNLYKTKELAGAAEAYNKALLLKPDEIYPKQRVSQIKNTISAEEVKKQIELGAGYQNAMIAAEKSIAAKDYQAAKSFYLQAQQFKPDDAALKGKVSETDNLIVQENKLKQQNQLIQNQYNAAIQKADQLFLANNYSAAKTVYQDAKNIKPDEPYPSQKIQEIERLVSAEQARKQQEIQTGYQTAITSGNKLLTQKQYQQAKESYEEALTFKPEDVFAKNKIQEADNLLKQELANQNALEAKKKEYNGIIAKADAFFTSKDYSSAKTEYQKAAIAMPDQAYPKQKIQEIDKLSAMAEEQKQKEIEGGYQKAVIAANSFYTQKSYENAKKSYQEALTYKPEDNLSKSRILELDNLIKQEQAKAQADQAKKKLYDGVIATADGFFNAKNYISAKTEYQKASQLMPAETYPKQKIDEIDKFAAMAEAQKQRDIEAGYQKAVTAANSFYTQKSYENARKSYQEALTYKPEDNLSKSRILELDNLIKQEQAKAQADQAKKKQYDGVIATADGFFNAKNYISAKTEYQKASQLMPAETYSKQKITEIDNLITEQQRLTANLQAKENNYKAAITKGDDLFVKKQYELAKAEYTNALVIKPGETYPKNKVTEIDNLLKQLQLAKEKDQNYSTAISEADRLFGETNYTDAKALYNKALGIKPAEVYPKNQLTKIDNLIAEAAKQNQQEQAKQQQYDSYIAQGDKLFDGGSYQTAKDNYKKALEIKPNEAYPKARIAKIDETLVLLSQKKETTTTVQKQESAGNKSVLAELKFKDDNERDRYLGELKKKYPSGVTEEIYKESNRITTRVIVIRFDEAREFRRVYFTSWGGSEYTLNGKPITQMFFEEQIKPKSGESYKKLEF